MSTPPHGVGTWLLDIDYGRCLLKESSYHKKSAGLTEPINSRIVGYTEVIQDGHRADQYPEVLVG